MSDKRKRKDSSDYSDLEDIVISRKSKTYKSKNKPKKPSDILDAVEIAEKLKDTIKTDLNAFTSTINDPLATLKNLKSIFIQNNDRYKLPPIIFQHQIYSVVENKTRVDREIENLKNSNEIRVFKCDSQTDDLAICFTQDYKEHLQNNIFDKDFQNESVKQLLKSTKISETEYKKLLETFQEKILFDIKEMSITLTELKLYHITECEITALIQTGVLVNKNANSWWFAIPYVGNFRRDLIGARKSLMNQLRRKKFKEMNIDELYQRNSKNITQIGIVYLVADLLGKELVRRIDSPMGFVIKYN